LCGHCGYHKHGWGSSRSSSRRKLILEFSRRAMDLTQIGGFVFVRKMGNSDSFRICNWRIRSPSETSIFHQTLMDLLSGLPGEASTLCATYIQGMTNSHWQWSLEI